MELDKIKVGFDVDLSGLTKDLKKVDKIVSDTASKTNGKKSGKKVGKDLGKGVSDGFNSSQGKILKNFKGMFEKMRSIGIAGTALITTPLMGMGAAAFAITKKSGEASDRLLDLSNITNMSTDNLQKWQYVATNAGVSTEAISSGVEGLTRRLKQADVEGSNFQDALAKLGMSYDNLSKLSMDKQMDLIMGQLARMEDGVQRNSVANELFGNSWKDLAPIIGMGADEISNVKDEASGLGVVMNNQQLQNLNKFRQEWDVLKLKISYISMNIATTLVPLLRDTLLPLLYQGAEFVRGLAERFKEISPETFKGLVFGATALAMFFPFIGVLSEVALSLQMIKVSSTLTAPAVAGVGTAATGASAGVELFGITLKSALGPIMLLFAALGLFIGVLWKAEDTSASTADTIGEKFGTLGQRMIGLLEFTGSITVSILGIVTNRIIEVFKVGMDKIKVFLNGLQSISNKLGIDWLSDKLNSGVSSIDGAINKLGKVQKGINDTYTDLLNGANDRMSNPMDYWLGNQVKKGKIQIETEIGGHKVSMLKDEVVDEDGKIKRKYAKIYQEEKERKRENPFDIDMSGFDKAMTGLPSPEDYGWEEVNLEVDDEAAKSLSDTKTAADLLAEAMKNMGENFKQSAQKIKDSIGMFDGFKIKTTSTYKLLRNAKQRAEALMERESTLNSLSNKGLSNSVMSQLYDSDMASLGDLKGLDRMSQEQLAKWASLQFQADISAEKQAMNQTVHVETINIDAKDRDFDEIEKELYRRLNLKGLTI